MLLNSWRFASFFAIIFLLYWSLPHKYRKYILLAANICFSLSWGAYGTAVVIGVSVEAYLTAHLIEKYEKNKKAIRAVSIFLCIANLFVFKYLNFAISSLNVLTSKLSFQFHPSTVKFIMPIGISYYTLQAIGYICDVYQGRIKAERDFISFTVFISFFPQITSGPISRAKSILPQIRQEKSFSYEKANYAVKLIAIGLFKKLVVADNLAQYVDRVYSSVYDYSGFIFIIIQFLFLFQLYGDFSGYSDLAKGAAMLLGIDIPVNFSSPYLSTTIGEFWSRWHSSLSSWLRDYVYIPLGGNRKGKARKCLNLMITFLVSGLWHGADWSFVIWGAINGIYQVLETVCGIRIVKPAGRISAFWEKGPDRLIPLKRRARAVYVFTLFAFVQIFFRASSISEASYIISNMFSGINSPATYISTGLLINNWIQGGRLSFLIKLTVCIIPIVVYDVLSEKYDVIEKVTSMKMPIKITIYLIVVIMICFFRSVSGVSFVYFQF